jgi:hypothetical protein
MEIFAAVVCAGALLGFFGTMFYALLITASKPTPKQEPKICTRKGCIYSFPNRACKPTKTATFGRRTYAEGRPTMPSEQESTIEYERRAPRRCACSDCMEPTLRDCGETDPPSLR